MNFLNKVVMVDSTNPLRPLSWDATVAVPERVTADRALAVLGSVHRLPLLGRYVLEDATHTSRMAVAQGTDARARGDVLRALPVPARVRRPIAALNGAATPGGAHGVGRAARDLGADLITRLRWLAGALGGAVAGGAHPGVPMVPPQADAVNWQAGACLTPYEDRR